MLMCCKLRRTGWQGFISLYEYNNLGSMDIKTTLPMVTKMVLAG